MLCIGREGVGVQTQLVLVKMALVSAFLDSSIDQRNLFIHCIPLSVDP